MSKKLPYKKFLETFKDVPRVAISLLCKDGDGNILLTKRSNTPFADYWHLPGSFILKNESQIDCIGRIFKEELAMDSKGEKAKLLRVFEDLDKDPRGHVVDIIYGYDLGHSPKLKQTAETKEAKLFKKLPPTIGFNHREVLNKLGYR